MAFSSLFSYMQDPLVPHHRRSDAALKRYESAKDPRAWSLDRQEKADFIHKIVKHRTACESSSDSNEASGFETAEIDGMSREQLLKLVKDLYGKIKVKEQLKSHESSADVNSKQAWNETENRGQTLEEVTKERNKLKETLCKIMGVSDLLRKLRERADEADQMESEINKLKRELQRCGYGAAGDNLPKRHDVKSECNQCEKYADDLSNSESVLEIEIKKSSEMEAERNFLRERVRASEVTEAECLLYKTKYEEAECKVSKLKEMLMKVEGKEKQFRDLQQQMETSQSHLKEAHRRTEELITIVERQEMDLKEREISTGNLNRRGQQNLIENPSKKAVTIGCPQKGKVQSIVEKMRCDPGNTNCKCGFENCQCSSKMKVNTSKPYRQASCTKKASVDTCTSVEVVTASKNLEFDPSCNSMHQKSSLTLNEVNRLQEEISSDEIRLLRQQNAELDQQLKRYKEELAKMTSLMKEVEQQRDSNTCMEEKVKELNYLNEKEMESIQTSVRASICEKDKDLHHLQQQLKDAIAKTNDLEKKLAAHCNEIKRLEPFQDRCMNLEEKLNCASSNETERSKEMECLQGDCVRFRDENSQLLKQISDLKIDLEEQRKYAKSLANQLCNRRNQKEKCQSPEDPAEDSDKNMLRKYVCDLKRHYDTLKQDKNEMVRCYENKIAILQEEALKRQRDGAKIVTECQCNGSTSGRCEDLLLKKLSKLGFKSLQRDELIDLHNRVRVAMMKFHKSAPTGNHISLDYYTKMADELRIKHNLSDALPIDPENIPVKDYDTFSSKTFPRGTLGGTHKYSGFKARPRSSKSNGEGVRKCVTIGKA